MSAVAGCGAGRSWRDAGWGAVVLALFSAIVSAPAGGQPTLRPSGVAPIVSAAAGGNFATSPAAMRREDGNATPPDDGAAPSAPRQRLGAFFGPDSAWWVPLSSAVLPGTGQARLGQDRFLAYMAVEAYAIVGWAVGEAAVRRERERYLALSHDIARAFVPGNNAIGDWDYYEAMEKHLESGVFDRTPGTGNLSPETDTTTFNGSVWLKARQLSDWPSVDVEPAHSSVPYQRAVGYYVSHAVGPEFRWSWRNAQLEWDVYRQSIRRKNDASHDASNYLAVLALNHILSTVDAFITLRLRGGLGASRSGYRLTATLPLP